MNLQINWSVIFESASKGRIRGAFNLVIFLPTEVNPFS